MKNLIVFLVFLSSCFAYSQSKKPIFENQGDLVKATYFYENGIVKTEGYFKNNKLSGEWITYDAKGNKRSIAKYKEGKKVGKWIVWTRNGVKEIFYENNSVVKVNEIKNETEVAIIND